MSLNYKDFLQILNIVLIFIILLVLFIIIFKFIKSNNQIDIKIHELEKKISNLEKK